MSSRTGYPPYDWRIDEIERKAVGAAKSHEVSALREHVDRLEYSLREVRSDLDGLRQQIYTLQENIDRLLAER